MLTSVAAVPNKIALAYSSGLDTSVVLRWLKARYPGVKRVAFAAELGQGDELKDIEAEAYCFPMLRAGAM